VYPHCPATGTLSDMATKGTPQRVIRVDEETWTAYGEVCADEGTNRADDLRRHMRTRIKNWQQEQRKIAAEQRAASA
jgi:hypothetical protein